jgi:hypothetical protein
LKISTCFIQGAIQTIDFAAPGIGQKKGLLFKYKEYIFIYREPLPGSWDTDLDPFQKMIVLKCLRMDKITEAMQDYVAASLGQRFIEPQVLCYAIYSLGLSYFIGMMFILWTKLLKILFIFVNFNFKQMEIDLLKNKNIT